MKSKMLVFAIGVAAVIGTFATAASAHHADVTGVSGCGNGARIVTWTIVNDQPKFTAVAKLTSNQTGLAANQVNLTAGGTATVKQTLDKTFTGSVTLKVDGTWSDGFTAKTSGEVLVAKSCVVVTTTTTPTTTPPTTATPTTIPAITTVPTTVVVVVSPAEISAETTTTTTPEVAGALAFTGTGTRTVLIAGSAALLLFLGWLTILAAREMKSESEALDYVKSVRNK